MTRAALVQAPAALLIAAAVAVAPGPAAALPAGFVDAARVVEGLIADMRYFGADNFVGEPIDGYERPRCLLTREAAAALAEVQRDLAPRGLGLRCAARANLPHRQRAGPSLRLRPVCAYSRRPAGCEADEGGGRRPARRRGSTVRCRRTDRQGLVQGFAMALMTRMFAAALWLAAMGGAASAQLLPTQPYPWQMGMQESATQIMDYIIWFNWYTLVIGGLILLLVLGLIGWCIVRYNREAHPTPSRVTHNTLVEVTWTVVPILILVAIAVPSFRLLYAQHDPARMYEDYRPGETPWLTVKVTGYQWFWGAEYGVDEQNQENGVVADVRLDILMTPDEELVDGQPRLLTVDNPMVVPVDTFVRVLVTAGDVLHAFAMPAFGVKIDAVPGRINETYFRAYRTGIFYGQCSELCGKDHAYMPLVIKVVEQDHFRQWAAAAAENLGEAYELLDRLTTVDAGRGDEEREVASR